MQLSGKSNDASFDNADIIESMNRNGSKNGKIGCQNSLDMLTQFLKETSVSHSICYSCICCKIKKERKNKFLLFMIK